VRSVDEDEGDVRFHHLTPELWVMEARRSARRWVAFHETYTFCLMTKIEGDRPVVWRYDHRDFVADPLHAMIMQPGELHAQAARTPPADFIAVHVGPGLMRRVAASLGWTDGELNVSHPHPGSDHPAVLDALHRFRNRLCDQLFTPRSRPNRCVCRQDLGVHLQNLRQLVSVFIRHCSERTRQVFLPGRGAAVVSKALRYLRANYKEPYQLDRISRIAGCNPHYLVHLFTREVGVPPSVYQRRILVAKTCQALVASPHEPLQMIAHRVGWPGRGGERAGEVAGDQDRATLLIRHFRRALGVTPDEFRAGVRLSAR
jgi:AraC-like DNA-binding protein